MRVYELARELEVESKELLARAQDLGLEVKTASSGLSDEDVELLKLSYAEQTGAAEAASAEADAEADAGEAATVETADHEEDAGEGPPADQRLRVGRGV